MSSLLLFLFLFLFASTATESYNVMSFGAKPDGLTDSSVSFLRAWSAACRNTRPVSVVVPKGRFFVSKAQFYGPCKNNDVKIYIFGSVVTKPLNDTSQNWLVFRYVDGLSIHKGVFDGHGSAIWACKSGGSGSRCLYGATTLSINHCKNVLINGLTLLNSQLFHISVLRSEHVTIRNTNIIAPLNSTNTDGIHIGMSTYVTIAEMNIRTGDDCISLGPGSTNVWIDTIYCGRGHGISIGSLAETPVEAGVRNVTVRNVVLAGTTNGFRIKSYDRNSNSFLSGASFRNAVMQDVQNPIVIDQNYCASYNDCPNQNSGIRISNVLFSNIRGTSATPLAIKFDCSPRYPCNDIRLKDIKLTYRNRAAQSLCRNVHGSASGFVTPPSCF